MSGNMRSATFTTSLGTTRGISEICGPWAAEDRSEALLQGFCHDGRKGKIIQDLAQALRGLGECELALPGGIFQPCALGQSYRQSGNVRLRY